MSCFALITRNLCARVHHHSRAKSRKTKFFTTQIFFLFSSSLSSLMWHIVGSRHDHLYECAASPRKWNSLHAVGAHHERRQRWKMNVDWNWKSIFITLRELRRRSCMVLLISPTFSINFHLLNDAKRWRHMWNIRTTHDLKQECWASPRLNILEGNKMRLMIVDESTSSF